MIEFPERYLGDGVYVSFDGYQIWLKTQEGMQIALEKEVYFSLLNYRAELLSFIKELQEKNKVGSAFDKGSKP